MPYISVSSQTTLNNPANFLVFAIYAASAPTVLLEKVAPAKPYGDPLQVTFITNFTQGLYRIKLWESVDDTATGTVRNDFAQALIVNSILTRTPLYMEADVMPAGFVSGGPSYSDTSLAGWDYNLELVGDGTLFPDNTSASVPDYTQDAPGGWTLLNGIIVQPNQKFVIFFTPQVIQAPAGTASPLFQSARIITVDTVLGADPDKNKAIILQGATSVLNITMPVLAAVADFDPFYIFSNGGNHINASLICQGSDKFFHNGDVSTLILGKAEHLNFFKAFGKFYINGDLPGVKAVGELLYNYGKLELNTGLCDGGLYLRAEYPREWAFVQSLESGVVVTDSVWTSTFVTVDGITYFTKKGFYSTGNGTTTFRRPLLTNMMLKGGDGTARKSGSLEIEQGIDHRHATFHSLAGSGAGGYIGGGSPVEDPTNFMTGKPRSATTTALLTRMGSKNFVDNISAYCLIRV